MQLPLKMPGLPAYRLRVSTRAKRASISVCPLDGIVLTVPKRFDQRKLPTLLQEWQPWIERQLIKLEAQRSERPDNGTGALPDVIDLPALAHSWQVEYQARPTATVRLHETARGLSLSGKTGDLLLTSRALQRWLARQARRALEPMTRQLADQHGFSFRRLGIRGQRTRWGSCSSSGTISLNYHLMFLQPELVRCVVLHELCHTRWMNHGQRFHALLARLEPDYAALDRRIHAGWQRIPGWAWRR